MFFCPRRWCLMTIVISDSDIGSKPRLVVGRFHSPLPGRFLHTPKCWEWLIGEYLFRSKLPSLSATYFRELNQPFHPPPHGKLYVKHVVLPMDKRNMEV